MSKDKGKKLTRRLRILWSISEGNRRLIFHREGGMALADPDVQRLVRDGFLKIVRARYSNPRLSPKKFVGNFRRDYRQIDEHAPRELPEQGLGCRPSPPPRPHNGFLGGHLHGNVNVTQGFITDAGRAFLLANEHKDNQRNFYKGEVRCLVVF